jgi:hypothetical protein
MCRTRAHNLMKGTKCEVEVESSTGEWKDKKKVQIEE